MNQFDVMMEGGHEEKSNLFSTIRSWDVVFVYILQIIAGQRYSSVQWRTTIARYNGYGRIRFSNRKYGSPSLRNIQVRNLPRFLALLYSCISSPYTIHPHIHSHQCTHVCHSKWCSMFVCKFTNGVSRFRKLNCYLNWNRIIIYIYEFERLHTKHTGHHSEHNASISTSYCMCWWWRRSWRWTENYLFFSISCAYARTSLTRTFI